MSEDPRADALSALSQFVVTELSLGDALLQVSSIARDAIPAASVAGISMLGANGQPTTGVYTDETSPAIDALQYSSGRGPCLDAWRTKRIIHVDEVSAAQATYPEFAEAALAHDIHSTLSLPLISGDDGIGALNLYAPKPGAFSDADQRLGFDLATTASVVLVNAAAYWEAFELSQHLNEAMKSRAVIEQAKGMLMARSETMTPDAAFEILRKASQRENVKLRAIAQRIVNREPISPTTEE